ncbi:MAG: Shedu immune nuclease family protein, partial [Acidimicrobiales bacterium]
LKTTGLIQTLCFGEIKTHRKSILKETKAPYRPDSWAISEELAGGISQIQKTIQKSLKNINSALSINDDNGFKLRHPIYLYKPKSFLIIGSLKEFKNIDGDIHEEKFSSFELFRRSISDIEIITFDELYERAFAIVRKKWK